MASNFVRTVSPGSFLDKVATGAEKSGPVSVRSHTMVDTG